jgi:hypothetical protein
METHDIILAAASFYYLDWIRSGLSVQRFVTTKGWKNWTCYLD